MARTNFEKDRELDFRMFVTGLGLVLLYAVVVTIMIRLGLSVGFVTFFCAAALFAQYFFSDKIAMFSMRAHEVSSSEEPQLHAMVDRLCAMADMKKPKVAIADTDVPNAFATGRDPQHAVVAVTTGIANMFRIEELRKRLLFSVGILFVYRPETAS